MPSLKVDLIVDSVQSQKIAQVGDQAEQMGQKVTQAHIKSSHAIFAHMSGMEQLVFTYMRWTMIAATIAAPIYALERAMQAGLKTVDNFKLATIGIAATLTDSLKGSDAEIKSAYQNNLRYAEDMYKRVETAAAKYFASGKEMVEAWQILTNKGMLLTSQQDIDNLGVIVDRIKLSTQGQVSSLQIAQEMRAVLSGQAKATDQIALMLKDRLGPSWAQQLKAAVDQGKALEFLAYQFKGLGVASKDVENTMEAMGSTLKTTATQISRESFAGAYKDVVGYMQRANDYLKDHADLIKSGVMTNWERVKVLIESIAVPAAKKLTGLIVGFTDQDKIDDLNERIKMYELNIQRSMDYAERSKSQMGSRRGVDTEIKNLREKLEEFKKLKKEIEEIRAAELFFATPGTEYVAETRPQFNKPPTTRPDYKLEGNEAAAAFSRFADKILDAQENLEKLNIEFKGLDFTGPGAALNKSLSDIDQWYHGIDKTLKKTMLDAQQAIDQWQAKMDTAREKGDLIDPAAIAEYELAFEKMRMLAEEQEKIRNQAEAVKRLKIGEANRKDAESQIANYQAISQAAQVLYDITGSEEYLDKFQDINNQIIDAEMKKNEWLISGEDNLNLIRLAKQQEANEKALNLIESRKSKEMSIYMELYQAYGDETYIDKAAESNAKILDIEEKRIAKLLGSEENAHAWRLAKEQTFWNAVIQNLTDKAEIYKTILGDMNPVSMGYGRGFDMSGMQDYAQKSLDALYKSTELQAQGLRQLGYTEEEILRWRLAMNQKYWDDVTNIMKGKINEALGYYQTLYRAYGNESYLDKAKALNSQVLDIEEARVKAILGSEEEAHQWRLAKEQEFQNSMVDLVQQGANQQINIAASTAKSIEQYMGFNVPIQGTNISSMTGMPIGKVGEIWSNPTKAPGKYFPSEQALNDYLRSIEKTTESQTQLSQSSQNLSSAFNQFESSLKSSYQNFQQFVTGRERRSWTAQDWEKEFTRLTSLFQSTSDPGEQLNTLNDMLDVLKELDKISEQQLQAQRQLSEDYLKSSQGIDDFINSLKYGPQAAYTSYGGMQTQYGTLKSQAGSPEGAQEFISFIQNTFLPYMKMFAGGGPGYGKIMEGVITDLETASDTLKGKSALLALSDLLGIDLNAKWEVTPDQLFLKKDWAPEDIKLWTDNPEDMSALFHKIENWNPTQLSLWGSLFDADFMSDAGVLTWTPTQLNLWAQLFSTDVFTWKPETLNLWADLFTTDAFSWNPEKIDLWAKDAKIALFTKDQWAALPVTTQDLINLTLTAIPVAIQNGDFEGAKRGINDLIGIIGDPGGLAGTASGTVLNVGGLVTSLGNTENPLDTVGTNMTTAVTNVKNAVTAIESFFNVLAGRIGVSFTGATAGSVAIPTKIETVQAATRQVPIAYTFLYTGAYVGSPEFMKDIYEARVVSGSQSLYLGKGEKYAFGATYPLPVAAYGALTSGLTLAGEEGRPEWIAPTVEPYRSKFLHDVGADPELIAQHILRKMAPIMQTGQGQGSGGDIVLMVDGYELGRITAKQIDSGHYEIVRAIRGRA